MKEVKQELALDRPATYQSRVPGQLDKSWLDWIVPGGKQEYEMGIPGYQRVDYFHRFENVRRRAQFWRFWRRLVGKPQTLLPFAPIYSRLKQRVGHRLGVQEIPLRQIVGSFDKAYQFDRAFRPLSDELRNRWVNIKMLQMTGGWEPIDVHKIGNLYFVEDGHHRVSVARDAGLEVIEANVVEYPLAYHFDLDDDLETILRHLETLRIDDVPLNPAERLPIRPCP